MPNVGPMELVLVLAVALIVLGPKKLPEVGRSLGRGLREFRLVGARRAPQSTQYSARGAARLPQAWQN